MYHKVDTMPDGAEIVHYDAPNIPLYIRRGELSYYIAKCADCHWHEDIELIVILDGEMNYYINGKTVLLKKSDGIIINSKAMHYGYAFHDADCTFICILFHPDLLANNKTLYGQYVLPLLDQSVWEYLPLTEDSNASLLSKIRALWALKAQGAPGYELEAIGQIYSLWWDISRLASSLTPCYRCENDPGVPVMKNLVSYIRQHYEEAISLSDLCQHAGISKSACNSLFKKHTRQSPLDYINQYRLQVAASLLLSTDMKITDISTKCGFNHHSYFAKRFARSMGCSPSDYRKGSAHLSAPARDPA